MKDYPRLIALCLSLFLSSSIFADSLDTQLQSDIQALFNQFPNSPDFSAVQLSVLLPGESHPRDYVTGDQSVNNSKVPATTTMLTQYGSITKEFTSALIIQYMYQNPNAFNLQATLGQLFPERFPSDWPIAWENITIGNLMNMASGIPTFDTPFIINPNVQYSLNDLVELMAVEQNTKGCILENGCFPVGSTYFYSNTNYILLGMIIEKLYGISYADVLNKNILQNQQMQGNSIYYLLNYPVNILENMLNGYFGLSADISPYLQPNQNVTSLNLTWGASAGAITGSTHALVNTINAFFHGNILSPNQTQYLTQTGFVQMRTGKSVPFVDANTQCTFADPCYGLGVIYSYDANYKPFYWYGGGRLGYSTIYFYLVKYDAVIGATVNTSSPEVIQKEQAMLLNSINQVISYISGRPMMKQPALSTKLLSNS